MTQVEKNAYIQYATFRRTDLSILIDKLEAEKTKLERDIKHAKFELRMLSEVIQTAEAE